MNSTVDKDLLGKINNQLEKIAKLEAVSQSDKASSASLYANLADALNQNKPAVLALILEALPAEKRDTIWQLLDPGLMGEILLEVHGDVRQQLIDASEASALLAALDTLEVDELADLDERLPTEVTREMVRLMDSNRRQHYEVVRHYPDDTAGGLMDVDAVCVRDDSSLKTAIRYLRLLRKRDQGLPEHLESLIVIDRNRRYLGLLKLPDLIAGDPEAAVKDFMQADIPAIQALADADSVVKTFKDEDLMSAAVVDENNTLLGRITVDDVIDVMREQAEYELMARAGLDPETDTFAPLSSSAVQRAMWLAVNLVNALISASVISVFEKSIEKIVALAVLMPIVASMGGAAGNQTLTLVTRGIALDQIQKGNTRTLLLREMSLGVINGLLWSVLVASIVVLWFGDFQIGLVFAIALTCNLVTASIAGTLVPLGLEKAGIDPALAGGVILLAITDVVGFAAFLGLATLVLL